MKNRILVIDDEEGIRFTFRKFLSREGHEIISASGYEEALEILSGKDCDLIFADIILGGRTGIELLKEIKDRELQCPVIIITGYPNVESAAEAVRLGAFDYISKPIQLDTLLRVTAIALQHKALSDEKERYRSNIEAIFRSVKDAIITIDREFLIVEMNESAGSICGFSRNDIGRNFGVTKTDCSKKCFDALKETITNKQPAERYRIECMSNKLSGQVVNITTFPLLDSGHTFSGAVMVVRDETRLSALENDLRELRQCHNIIGKSEKMQKIYSFIKNLSDIQTTVLITGESGTGKELVADAIHYTGDRSNKPLVKVNCSALTENLLESELFGHVKGAFTGAIADRIGRFQKADGGTIFLDEIGDISSQIQIKLLRVLQDMEFERVGDSTPVRSDVRIIAATNSSLPEKVKKGEFREDLYYRLKVVEIGMPPLRERREDISYLSDHFLKKLQKKFKKKVSTISDDVQRILMKYHWPGNVRELEHALEHAFIMCRDSVITPEDLPEDLKKPDYAVKEDFDDISVKAIVETLEKTDWNKSKTAKLLGISRQTLYRKIQEHRITKL